MAPPPSLHDDLRPITSYHGGSHDKSHDQLEVGLNRELLVAMENLEMNRSGGEERDMFEGRRSMSRIRSGYDSLLPNSVYDMGSGKTDRGFGKADRGFGKGIW